MEENDTSITLEEGGRETKLKVRVEAFSCRVCGYVEFWRAEPRSQ